MRSLAAYLLFVACAVSAIAAPTNYIVTANGQKLGTGTVELKLLPNGNFKAVIGMKLSFGGSGMESTEEQLYAKDGMPILFRETRNMSASGKEMIEHIFGRKALTTKTTKGGKTTSKTIPYPATGTMKSISTFWFITFKPKVGAVDTSWHFDEKTQKWESSSTKYAGVKDIKVGGKNVKAHLLENQNGRFYTDDKGVPYRMEIDESGVTIVLERP